MKFPVSKTKRLIYLRKIQGFFEAFFSHRVGIAGLILLASFVIFALLSPYISPYDPYALPRVAKNWAPPAWLAIFPEYRSLNPTIEIPLKWSFVSTNQLLVVESFEDRVSITYNNQGVSSPQEIVSQINFSFPYQPPPNFIFSAWYNAPNVTNTRYIIQFLITNPDGKKWILSQINSTTAMKYATSISSPVPSRSEDSEFRVYFVARNYEGYEILLSTDPRVRLSKEYREKRDYAMKLDPCQEIFSKPGEYGLVLRLVFMPVKTDRSASATVNIITYQADAAKLTLWGHLHGILGTDYLGKDVFAQVAAGARISLMVGILSAMLSVSIGIIVGVTAGYVGGFLDEGLMRMVDVLLCLPTLPILLVLVSIWGASIWYIVILIAIFGWQGLSRIIRSRVLSLKEMSFVEAARASGASTSYILLKHIVPNVMPIAISAMILSVPGAILTEASLSFIGFGDPTVPTWGRLLHFAQQTGAFSKLAWWVILPPGIAISLLCLGFIFIGHSIDEILNPRLRRRR